MSKGRSPHVRVGSFQLKYICNIHCVTESVANERSRKSSVETVIQNPIANLCEISASDFFGSASASVASIHTQMRTSSPDVVTSKLDEGNRLRGSNMPPDPLPKQFMSTMLTRAYHDVNSNIKHTCINNILQGNYNLEIPTQESIRKMCTDRMMLMAEDGLKMISSGAVVTSTLCLTATDVYDLGKDQDIRATSDMTPLAQQVRAVQDGVDGLLLLMPKTNA